MAWISLGALPCRGEKINPLNAELNPTCHLLALLGAHHILHVSRIRVNDSPCLDFVEIARGPDMLLSSFPSWSGLSTYQHPDIAAVKQTIIKNSSFCRQLNSEFFWNLSRRIRLIESASVVTCLSGGQTEVAPRDRDTQTFMWDLHFLCLCLEFQQVEKMRPASENQMEYGSKYGVIPYVAYL